MEATKSLNRPAAMVLTSGVYFASVGLLFVGELAFASVSSMESLAVYQLARNALPVAVALGLLGIDQSLMREVAIRSQLPRLGRWCLPSVYISVLAAFLLALGFSLLGGLDAATAIGIFVASVSLGLLYVVGGLAKGLGFPAVSSVFLQGYRLVLGTGLLLMAITGMVEPTAVNAIWILVLAATGLGAFGSWWYSRHTRRWSVIPEEARRVRTLGYAFAAPMLAVALVDWLDQLLVASFFGLDAAGEYGIAKLLTVFPVLSIASVLSFVALPFAVRVMPEMTLSRLRRVYFAGLLASMAISGLVAVAANAVLTTIYDVEIHWSFFLFLSLAASVRLFYVVPSAVVGAQGSRKALAAVGVSGFVGILLLVLLSAIGAYLGGEFGLTWVAAGLFLAHASRTWVSVSRSLRFILQV